MRKPFTLFALIAIVFLSSSVLKEKERNVVQSLKLKINGADEIPKSAVEKGKITIKVKKNFGRIQHQKGSVRFNIESLDKLSEEFELQAITHRFRFNPSKMKAGLPDLSRIYKVSFPENYSPQRVIKAFLQDPNIEYAEPIPKAYPFESPDDPCYNNQHFLPQIKAEEAWEIHKGEDGTEEVIIAIVDTGVDWDHEDLLSNAWQNMGEDADGDGTVIEFNGYIWVMDPDDENGIDDDGNGVVDDFTGWNYFNENNDPSPEYNVPYSDHGTHCAGLAAATTNNDEGVASISWNVSFMSLQVYDPVAFEMPWAYDGIIYAAENGADIISNSWGDYYFSRANLEAIEYATGMGSIIVAASGNNNKYFCSYPASYPDVISVAALSKTDEKASYSNFGPNITISAPGGESGLDGLQSTVPNDGYNYFSGTSMATPVTSGLLGLVRSYHPEWTNEEVITQVIGTADDIDMLNPEYIHLLGSGRINAFRALAESGINLPQEIKLDIFNVNTKDHDHDNLYAPGDSVTIGLTLRNFSLGVSDPNATFHISCVDPDITIIKNNHYDTIPSDNYFTLDNAFQFVIDEDADTHEVEFHLVCNSTYPIVYGDTLTFKLIVAPSGILVYRGEGSGDAYSGEYIRDFLEDHEKDVLYTTTTPTTLNGFSAVFMSMGNLGWHWDDGTRTSDSLCEAIVNYLEDGGNLYIECGSFFFSMIYYESTYLPIIKELMSIEEIEILPGENYIDSLYGLEGSLAEGLYFIETIQYPCSFIEKFTPDLYGKSTMEEHNYGVVAIQGDGEFGQKTFLMSYAISKLQSGETGMEEQLMIKVCQHLGIDVSGGIGDQVSGSRFQVSGYPNPTSSIYSIAITLDQPEGVTIQLYDIMGNAVGVLDEKIVMNGEVIQVNMSGLEKGIYFSKIQINGETITKKIIKN